MKPVLPRLALLLLAGLLGSAVQAAKPPTQVIVAEVASETVTDPIEALGTLAANESVTLTATVAETVSAIHFDDGDRVTQGQVLVEMTSREEHAELDEARATVNEARRQFQRIQSLEAQGTAAKALLDERRREWETARARLAAIESRLADRLIKAPFDGVLGLREISTGALVQPGDTITTLDDDSVMKLEFHVPGVFLDALRPGVGVVARSRAFTGRDFNGTVSAVNSRIDPVTRAVRVRARVPNPDRLLRPGMLLQVVLENNPRTALVIPEEAVISSGTAHHVLVLDGDNKAARRDITIGTRMPGKVEVVAGLAAGERVISQGAIRVKPGQAVEVATVDDGSRPLAEILRTLPGGSGQE